MKVTNKTQHNMINFAIRLDRNPYKLESENIAVGITQLAPDETQNCRIVITTKNEQSNNQPPDCPLVIQVALNTSLDVFVFNVPLSFTVVLKRPPPMSVTTFGELMQRPNQVKAKNNIQTNFSPEQV